MTFRLLFVCTGNVCRSPAAERLLRAQIHDGDVEVSSAGTHALVGEPMTEPMAELVAAQGADPVGFAARQLTPELVRDADLIVALTSDHRTLVVRLQPAAVQRTFVLGELAHMLADVSPNDLDLRTRGDATQADRMRALVGLAKGRRTPGIDPEEDVPDPYGRSASEYARSAGLIVGHLQPVVRLVVGPR